jgi:hypothetical protein
VGAVYAGGPLSADAFTTVERSRVVRAMYEYTPGNPLRYSDPLGLRSCPGSCGVDCPGGGWFFIDGNGGGGVLFGKQIRNRDCILYVLDKEMRI